MAKIDQITEQKIKAAAKIVDVFADAGISLHRQGSSLVCLCPFHEDRHMGSFIVNARGNYYKCFSCGASGDPVKFVMEYYGKKYPEALRYLAAMYGIFVDDEPAPQVVKREPRKPEPPTPMIYWDIVMMKPYLHHADENPLLRWMLALPYSPEHLANLRQMIEVYCVGTSLKGATQGWAMFPEIDTDMRLRDVKMMAYKEDGHRDKDRPAPWDPSRKYSTNWMSALLKRVGKYNPKTHHIERCLFGLHLAAIFPKAEVCIVESEKSALICSAFSDPNEKIWMATGGKEALKPDILKPLIEAQRDIVLYPDLDGYDEWQERMQAIGYQRMSISRKPKELAIAKDGAKADIADIMIRLMHGIEETTAEIACRRLNIDGEQAQHLTTLIERMNLQIID